MKIRIFSKTAIEKYTNNPLMERTAIISITDYGFDFAELKNQPLYLYQISFNDVDNDVIVDDLGDNPNDIERKAIEEKYHMLSDQQAKEIANFYFSICISSLNYIDLSRVFWYT